MAVHMIWAHEIVHYFAMSHFNIYVFMTGIILSVGISIFLLRKQFLVNDEWLKRMISHHSTVLTTSNKIYKRTRNPKLKKAGKRDNRRTKEGNKANEVNVIIYLYIKYI